MGRETKSEVPRNCRRARVKVKTGCRTCKIRKVKCDEWFPACRRCIASGRVCDGYGVWGGGGNSYGLRHQQATVSENSSLRCEPPRYISSFGETHEERQYFDWFQCRTAKKIPGAFVLKFWDTLLFQASWDQPAVLHAVLTLSSVHKTDDSSSKTQEDSKRPIEQEQFMLQHYSKAIRHLQPLFSSKDRASIRVALITCVVFVSLELLRGRFKTAQTHLEAGLKVLKESDILHINHLSFDQPRDPIDIWIVEVFSRLHTQVELFRRTYRHPSLFLRLPTLYPPKTVFHSAREAWQPLEQIFNRVFCVAEQARQRQSLINASTSHSDDLVIEQGEVQTELAQWLEIYKFCQEDLLKQEYAALVCLLLESYHTLASIMAGTCLWAADESIYDQFTDQFNLLLQQSTRMWRIGSPHTRPQRHTQPKLAIDMSRSLIDLGWIPLLYYMAIKCRVHRIRLQSIRLLESASHREGIWDSIIASRIARRVMEIEESGFYNDFSEYDDFSLDTFPDSRDLSVPVLPQSNRMDELQVLLADEPMDIVLLSYRQQKTGGNLLHAEVSINSPRFKGRGEYLQPSDGELVL